MIGITEIDERQYLIDELERTQERVIALEKNTYAAPHVWNLVAKGIRQEYASYTYSNNKVVQQSRRTLEKLALAYAKRFTEDEGFDPPTWLDKCSPDPDLYPFSEMWEDE